LPHDNYNALHGNGLLARGDINMELLCFLTSVKRQSGGIIVGVEPFVATQIEVNENCVFNPHCWWAILGERITINNADCRNL